MFYSKSKHANGSSGFFVNDDQSMPSDVIEVSEADFIAAVNLPKGHTYDFIASSSGLAQLVTTEPDTSFLLQEAKNIQIGALQNAYQAAIVAPVSYTTVAGTTATFPQDTASKSNLEQALLSGEKSSSWPLNLWLDVNGNPVSPFTYSDLQGLAAAMGAADSPEYMHLLEKIAAVNSATSIDAVEAVTWAS